MICHGCSDYNFETAVGTIVEKSNIAYITRNMSAYFCATNT